MPAITLAMFIGDELGVIEARYQPMKIAAAEAQWTTCQPCSFSLFRSAAAATTRRRRRSSPCPRPQPARHQLVERQGHRPERTERRVPGEVRPGELRAQRLRAVLVHAGHGLRGGLVFLFGLWGIWLLQRRKLEHAKWFLRLAVWGLPRPHRDEQRGLAPHRGRPPAVDRPGPDADQNGVSPKHHHPRHRHQPDGVRVDLRGARCGRRRAHGALRPPRPRTRAADTRRRRRSQRGAPETGDERIPELVY